MCNTKRAVCVCLFVFSLQKAGEKEEEKKNYVSKEQQTKHDILIYSRSHRFTMGEKKATTKERQVWRRKEAAVYTQL